MSSNKEEMYLQTRSDIQKTINGHRKKKKLNNLQKTTILKTDKNAKQNSLYDEKKKIFFNKQVNNYFDKIKNNFNFSYLKYCKTEAEKE